MAVTDLGLEGVALPGLARTGGVLNAWELVAGCVTIGPGHAGGGIPISCATPPVLGGAWCVSFPGPSPPGLGWLLLGPGPARYPAAILRPPLVCSPAFLYPVAAAMLPAYGSPATVCVPIPADPALAGAEFVAQGFSLQSAGCLRATDAILVTVVP